MIKIADRNKKLNGATKEMGISVCRASFCISQISQMVQLETFVQRYNLSDIALAQKRLLSLSLVIIKESSITL